jgi:hypothetical protein
MKIAVWHKKLQFALSEAEVWVVQLQNYLLREGTPASSLNFDETSSPDFPNPRSPSDSPRVYDSLLEETLS